MVGYRRARVAGATYFFTVALRDRRTNWLVLHVDALRESIHLARREAPFVIDAMVVMPDHLHAVWTLPPGDADFPGRWRKIKARFTRTLVQRGVPLMRNHKGEYDLWQRRYWEHLIRDDRDLSRHVDYIHYNPVKHGFVERPTAWRWSSVHTYIRRGLLPADWAFDVGGGGYGE